MAKLQEEKYELKISFFLDDKEKDVKLDTVDIRIAVREALEEVLKRDLLKSHGHLPFKIEVQHYRDIGGY